jgi:hypothetical protein
LISNPGDLVFVRETVFFALICQTKSGVIYICAPTRMHIRLVIDVRLYNCHNTFWHINASVIHWPNRLSSFTDIILNLR